MPKSKYHEAVDAIQATLRPWLIERSFRVRGRAFNRVTDDGLTQVVSIQMGPFEPPGTVPIPGLREDLHGWFTVNLGVYVPEVALHQGGGAKSWVREYHCAIRARLGQVCSDGQDVWWRAEASPEVIAAVRERLLVGGLPWLDRFAGRGRILDQYRDRSSAPLGAPPRIVMAIILAARGDSDAARALLVAQASDSTVLNPHHAGYVRELSLKLGLGRLDG